VPTRDATATAKAFQHIGMASTSPHAPDTAMAMVYHGLIGPAVQHISAFMEQKLLPKIAPGSLVHATRIRREFLSRAACNLAPK